MVLHRTGQKGKKTCRSILVIVFLYIICLFLTIGCLHLLQFRYHKDIKENVITGAAQLSAEGDMDSDFDDKHMGIYMYVDGEISGLQGHESAAFENYERFVRRYERFSEDEKANYTIAPSLSVPYFTAVASAPVYENGVFYGELFMVKGVRYTPAVFYTCLIGYTLAFFLIYVSARVVRSKNEKINEIYRCYVANVSHELKSPIASILAMAETLNEGLVTSEESRAHCYGMITREARQLERTVQDIMELSRLQEHRVDLSKSIIEINDLMEPVQDIYMSRCEDLDIRLCIDDSVWNIPPLYTNKTGIGRVFAILLDNAIKFTGHDSQGIIRISVDVRGTCASFCVSDNGTGIREEAVSHVFERFYKDASSINHSGSGLGLAIAKEIISSLGEEISVKSKPGEGARFYFTVHMSGNKKQHW